MLWDGGEMAGGGGEKGGGGGGGGTALSGRETVQKTRPALAQRGKGLKCYPLCDACQFCGSGGGDCGGIGKGVGSKRRSGVCVCAVAAAVLGGGRHNKGAFFLLEICSVVQKKKGGGPASCVGFFFSFFLRKLPFEVSLSLSLSLSLSPCGMRGLLRDCNLGICENHLARVKAHLLYCRRHGMDSDKGLVNKEDGVG